MVGRLASLDGDYTRAGYLPCSNGEDMRTGRLSSWECGSMKVGRSASLDGYFMSWVFS